MIHVAGQRYGIKYPLSQCWPVLSTKLERESTGGTHQAHFAEAAAIDIANAYTSAVYLDNSRNKTHFDMSEAPVHEDALFQLVGVGT